MVESQWIKSVVCLMYSFLVAGILVSAKPALDSNTDSKEKSCNFKMTDSSGEILSPNYPQRYPNNKECTWQIEVPMFQKIVLVFETFNFDPSSREFNCARDFVEVRDGELGLIGRYCAGNIPPRQLTSSSHSLTVIFKTDNQTTPGFQGYFRAIYASCGGFFTDPSGDLSSPSYPKRFPADVQCLWQIRVPLDYVIELRFHDFNMGGMYPCNVDFVKVTDGFNTSATELGHFCATRPPGQSLIRSTGNKMSLEFKSYKDNSRGFKAHYARVPHCNGFLESDHGRFTSPGYPGTRQMNKECSWLITVSEGKIISLMFESFDVDSETSILSATSTDCKDDYVEVFDGTSQNDRSLGKFCTINNKPLTMLRSSGRQMFVRLQTSFRNEGDGFLASYYGIEPDNYFEGCDVFDNQLFFTCDNGQKIQCQWKCDGTNDCEDGSDERQHCASTPTPASRSNNDIRNYVIVILSITGSALAIVCIGFIIDRLRRKRTSRPRRRRHARRLRRPRLSNTDEAPLTDEPSSPPPPYELSRDNACFDIAFIQPHIGILPSTRGDTALAAQNSAANQNQTQESAENNLENSSANGRVDENSSSNSGQDNAQEMQIVQSEGESISVNVIVGTISPSESISSLNDTAPLIPRSGSVIEL